MTPELRNLPHIASMAFNEPTRGFSFARWQASWVSPD